MNDLKNEKIFFVSSSSGLRRCLFHRFALLVTFVADTFYMKLSEKAPWLGSLQRSMDGAAFVTSTIAACQKQPKNRPLYRQLRVKSHICQAFFYYGQSGAWTSKAILSLIAIEHGFHQILELEGFSPLLKFLGVKAAKGQKCRIMQNNAKFF